MLWRFRRHLRRILALMPSAPGSSSPKPTISSGPARICGRSRAPGRRALRMACCPTGSSRMSAKKSWKPICAGGWRGCRVRISGLCHGARAPQGAAPHRARHARPKKGCAWLCAVPVPPAGGALDPPCAPWRPWWCRGKGRPGQQSTRARRAASNEGRLAFSFSIIPTA